MIYSVLSKMDCSLTVILSAILNYGKIDITEVEINDCKVFPDGEKSFVLIGDGRKLRPALERLAKLNGRSNFDWCCVVGA